MKLYKLVLLVPDCFPLDIDKSEYFWIKKWETINNTLYGYEYETWFFETKEKADEIVENLVKKPESAESKLIYRGWVYFDDEFIRQVNEARQKYRSFGEFGFNCRKRCKKETIDRLGVGDRNKIDYIKETLVT